MILILILILIPILRGAGFPAAGHPLARWPLASCAVACATSNSARSVRIVHAPSAASRTWQRTVMRCCAELEPLLAVPEAGRRCRLCLSPDLLDSEVCQGAHPAAACPLAESFKCHQPRGSALGQLCATSSCGGNHWKAECIDETCS